MFELPNLGSSKRYFPVTIIALLVLSLSVVSAKEKKKTRKGKGAETYQGTIVKVEKKGRTRVITIKNKEDEEKEYILSARTPVSIEGEGDASFFKPGVVISTEVYKSKKNLLFGKEFTVHLDGAGKKRGYKPAKGKDVFDLIGPVVKASEKEITLNLGRAGSGKVQLESGYTVKLVSKNPELMIKGADVELEGIQARGNFRTKSVSVTLKEPLDAEQYFESLNKNKKRGRRKIVKKSRGKKQIKKKGTTTVPATTKNPFADIDKKNKEEKKGDKKKDGGEK